MARARNIKPGFFSNPELVELRYEVRLLFIGLWTLADREGRLEDRPKKIKMELFPADDIDIDTAISDLGASGFVRRYEVDNVKIIQILNFTKHQKPHHQEKESELPEEPTCEPLRTMERVNPSDSLNLIPDTLNTDTGQQPNASTDADAVSVENHDQQKPPKKNGTQRFTKPTKPEIARYCRENNYNVDAIQFFNYYESNGWRVGRNPMKDWKAAVRTWARKAANA